MRKRLLIIASVLGLAFTAGAQSALEAYQLSQPGLYGTARFIWVWEELSALLAVI